MNILCGVIINILLFLFFLSFPSFIYSQTCLSISQSLNPTNSYLSLTNGINFLDTPSLSDSDGYHLCLQAGNTSSNKLLSKPKIIQIDTGSTGVVLPLSYLTNGTYSTTGRCFSFSYLTNPKAYFGELVSTTLRFFGPSTDGRYFDTHPMIILAVEYTCTGTDCLSLIASKKNNCTEVRTLIATDATIKTRWKTAESTIGMVGVGYNRGNSEADASFGTGPVALSRNPFMKINIASLSSIITPSPINPIAPAINTFCSSVYDPVPKTNTNQCFRDSVDPNFALNSSFIYPSSLSPPSSPSVPNNGGVYAYIFSATKLRFLISAPYIVNPLSSPIFQCGRLNSITPSSQWAGGAPSFTCFDDDSYESKSEILSGDNLSSSVIWKGKGPLIPDTGIDYYVHRTNNYPCMTGNHTFRLSLINNALNQLNYTFNVDMNSGVPGASSSIYYNTSYSNDNNNYLPPTKLRLWPKNSGTLCSNNINPNIFDSQHINAGRMILSSFVYLFDALHGVVGYANATQFQSLVN